MHNTRLQYSDILFLYKYFHQIDLSLDRARWTTWPDLQQYYKQESISPLLILQYFQQKYHITQDEIKSNYSYTSQRKFKTIWLQTALFKYYVLEREALIHICHLLIDFDKILESKSEKYLIEFEILRQKVITFYVNPLRPMLTIKDNNARTVEHYFQAFNTTCIPLSKYIPKSFYKRLL
jgi:hypothetical protein